MRTPTSNFVFSVVLLGVTTIDPSAQVAEESFPPDVSSLQDAAAADSATASEIKAVKRRKSFPRPLGQTGLVLASAGLAPFIVMVPIGVSCGLSEMGDGSSEGPVCSKLETAMIVSAVVMGVGTLLALTDFTLWVKESREAKVTAMEEQDRPVKYASTAYVWAAGATAVPFVLGLTLPQEPVEALIISGLVFGPSAGQFYAGATGQGMIGIGMRTVALTMASTSANEGLLLVVAIGGAGYSLVDTWFAVRRANEKGREQARADTRRPSVRTSFAPTLFPVGEGRFAPGLAAQIRF